jgi:hypothetical protein
VDEYRFVVVHPVAAGANQSTLGPADQSPSGCRFTTRVRLLIKNRPAGFSATAAASAARAEAHRFR